MKSLRIHIEIVQTSKYRSFLDTFFPVFEEFLTHTTTPQTEDNDEQKIRYEVLDILSRLPTNEVMLVYAARLCKLVIFCLSHENEKNGLVCLRILPNLHQHFQPQIEREARAFIVFLHKASCCCVNFLCLKLGMFSYEVVANVGWYIDKCIISIINMDSGIKIGTSVKY